MGTTAGTLEDSILNLCSKFPDGLPDNVLEKELPMAAAEDRAIAINGLLIAHRLQIFKQGDGLVYKEVKVAEAVKFKGLGSEELLVYQIIQQSGNMGIWTKDLKMRSNLQQPQINKILKVLETRKLIKAVKSVANKNRKVYMLFELEPSREITGGAWYTEHEFDSEFIEVLRDMCHRYIVKEGCASLPDIAEFVASREISKVDLREEDVLSIVNTLVYDGKVDEEEVAFHGGSNAEYEPGTVVYKLATLAIPEESAFTNIPCGMCPVFSECSDDGLISPKTCVYYQKWLEF
mmetsp:Transcript_31278/g.99768  ORF Transcript_31278/g.99768 Transcript_31278/m.99768 type:complete len:291 (+) Transcript_31278:254-1126(+)|eukprot:CAMPEP_0182892024 /NCGR_PEP_ID=MMETSP0034_2-20130328/23614_1 /TAXON_ID=156128 /ORGANISM="Nephroselmis pyriformis, Strain CCMP717" /LENGTH=290 /DNA_ID=CAMNT_0025025667 /DNA_START=165 /DNA_END=1037 /DNA_ORIENTATION=-